mgnify:CR=1 FL=1|jgi:hypothetical protein
MSSSNIQILDPDKTSTVEEFINAGISDEMTYNNFSILFKSSQQDNIILSANNIIYDYMDEIKPYIVNVTLSEEEYIKYRYKPKLFAYDIYGSTELFFIVMAVNGIYDIKDFNRRNIKALYKKQLFELLNQIYNAESEYIQKNRSDLEFDN